MEPPNVPALTAASPPAETTPDLNIAAAPMAAEPPAGAARVSAEETAALLARGDALFSTGDLAAARLFYERAADAGEAQAAVRLGETFDPIFLDRAHLRGVPGNVETALSWYRRARDLGAAEAEVLLNSLQAK
jgi:TPR repeat protein